MIKQFFIFYRKDFSIKDSILFALEHWIINFQIDKLSRKLKKLRGSK